ncbi:MAG: hypothetical protein HQ517_06365 [SAR324 cluster bacterium]|nr:hypothetical protein [SAR324 cluster bacterium]
MSRIGSSFQNIQQPSFSFKFPFSNPYLEKSGKTTLDFEKPITYHLSSDLDHHPGKKEVPLERKRGDHRLHRLQEADEPELKVNLIILLVKNNYPSVDFVDTYKKIFEQDENFKKYQSGTRG